MGMLVVNTPKLTQQMLDIMGCFLRSSPDQDGYVICSENLYVVVDRVIPHDLMERHPDSRKVRLTEKGNVLVEYLLPRARRS